MVRKRDKAWLLAVAAAAALGAGCGRDRVVKTLPPGFRQDVFPQDAAAKIDVLWVIDNSASMQPQQQRLALSLSRFMDLFSRGLVDYRIAVTTTDVFNDQGEFMGSPDVIDPSLADPVATFQKAVMVGTGGKGHEEAFEAARLAIVREQAATAGVVMQREACIGACKGQSCKDDCVTRYTPRFMRPEAHLYLVFVSDEDEQSFGEVRYFQRTFEGALGVGNEGAVSAAVICGDVPTPPCTARPGTRYVALAQAMDGIVASICDATFEDQLARIALDAAGLKRKFGLSRPPDASTLSAMVLYRCDTPAEQMGRCDTLQTSCAGQPPEFQGKVCIPPAGEQNGWTFEVSTNSLFFNGDSVPGLRSVVQVSYQTADGS
jgi:hypothetical protein